MQYPATTGAVAQALCVHEPRLNDLIRRGKITPPPRIAGGRRLWERDHVVKAALCLGVHTTLLAEWEASGGE